MSEKLEEERWRSRSENAVSGYNDGNSCCRHLPTSPSKAEMNEEIQLDCTPKQLARAVLQDVKIETRAE